MIDLLAYIARGVWKLRAIWVPFLLIGISIGIAIGRWR